MRALAAVLAMCVTVSPATAQTTVDAPAIVDRVLDAYGGADAVRAVKAYRLEGRIDPVGGPRHGAIIRITEGSGRLKQLIRYASGAEIRIVEGGEGWNGGSPQHLAPARGPALGAMQLQAARTHIPWVLDEWRDILQVGSTGDDGILLSGDLSEGLTLKVVVDPESYRVVRSESVVRMGPTTIPFATDYSDFQVVDGVLFALHEETSATGAHTASIQFVRVFVNPPESRRKLPVG